MRKINILFSLFVLITGLSTAITAQTPTQPSAAGSTVKLSLIQGDVSAINADKIVIQTKDGSMDVALSNKTTYFRVSIEKPSLATATAANLSEIGVGDKLIVTGMISADKKSVPAVKVYLMTKTDIAQKQNKERQEWQVRGVTGQVAAINPQTKEITVSSRSFTGERKTVLSVKDDAVYRRYAPDSVDYNETKLSSIDEIKVGDSIRALGDKSQDGMTIKAERIVTGSFQTIGGTITAIDAAKNEITITDVQNKKPVIIVVGKNSVLKHFPAEAAQRMTQIQTGGITPGQGGIRPPRATTTGEPLGQTPNQTGQVGGMRGGNIDDMLERFPNISIADLKVGDMIAVSSTKNVNANRISAIKLLSGVEPFIKAQQQQATPGRPRRGVDTGLSIPGLDGSNFP